MKDEKLSVISDQSLVGGTGKKTEDYFFRASAADFEKIPGSPIAYWVSDNTLLAFTNVKFMHEVTPPKKGIDTGKNDKFLRYWHEIAIDDADLEFSVEELSNSAKWYRYNKGGLYRKWYGNNEYLVLWENDGRKIKAYPGSTIRNKSYLRNVCLTWSDVTSSKFSARFGGEGALHDNSGPCAFGLLPDIKISLGFLCSYLSNHFLSILNPTLHYQIGNIAALPMRTLKPEDIIRVVDRAVLVVKKDWDSYETSWDFTNLSLLQPDYRQLPLRVAYKKLRDHWQDMMLEVQCLEEENNRIFIDAYGLQDELTPEVPLNEITLTCNPHYRYNGNKSEEELEALLLADTMKEFISYGVGCMLGRYSLDAPGLILANQGETVEDYFRIVQEKCKNPEVTSNQWSVVSEKNIAYTTTDNCTLTDKRNAVETSTDNSKIVEISFSPDEDNVIPILSDNWFTDDISERFQRFLKITFGEEHYEENLKFIEDAIGKKLRKYFLKDFYPDHVKRYKKRPIYWLFSSPKGSFNALVYMHRYRPDTVSVILNDYLREFRTKLTARREHLEQVSISTSASKTEKTKALKEIEKLKKTITELEDYERDILYPLATQNIKIDLDDGVKVNYKKFGKALKKVPGLS